MPANTFINFDKKAKSIKGESYQDGLLGTDGWIELSDWSWDIEADTSFMKGGGSAVGKPTPGNFTFTHYYDTSSHVLMERIVMGTHFEDVELVQLKQTGAGKPAPFLIMKFKWAFITKVSTKGAEDGSVTQDIEMVFKDMKLAYKMQLNDGSLEKTPVPFAWNIAKMNDKSEVVDPDFMQYTKGM